MNPGVIDETASRRSPTATRRSRPSGSPRPRRRSGTATVETYVYDLGGNGKSQILKTPGGIKVVRAKDGPVVGVHMVGARVGELIGEAQLIVGWEAYPEDVAPLIHGHPSQYEAMGEASWRWPASRCTCTTDRRHPSSSRTALTRSRQPEIGEQRMSLSVQMPALGESVTEGTVTRWLKKEGDTVEVDEPLLEVSTDKVDTEIPSPYGGVLERSWSREDETAAVGAELAVIGDGGGGRPASAAPPSSRPPRQPAEAEADAEPQAGRSARRSRGPAAEPQRTGAAAGRRHPRPRAAPAAAAPAPR